ncbi:hypothetical protein GGR58DRAFT_526708 [Xylaria digitata]|nr:hypothetical protein GGR58DRAFT_526708 [Xylaria digitata]
MSYDVARKLPTDMIVSKLDDFNHQQCHRAGHIANCLRAWSTTMGIELLQAFFVRWKTEKELEEETKKKTDQQHKPHVGRRGLEDPASVWNMIDGLNDSPAHK